MTELHPRTIKIPHTPSPLMGEGWGEGEERGITPPLHPLPRGEGSVKEVYFLSKIIPRISRADLVA